MTNIKHRIGFRIKKWKSLDSKKYIVLDMSISSNVGELDYLLSDNFLKIQLDEQ